MGGAEDNGHQYTAHACIDRNLSVSKYIILRTVLTVRYMFSLRLACFIFIRIADHIELLLIFYLIVSSIHFDFLIKKMLYQFVVFSQSNGWYHLNDTNCSHVIVDSVRLPGRNAPAVCFQTVYMPQ